MAGAQAATGATSPPAGVDNEHREMGTHVNGAYGEAHSGLRQGSVKSSSLTGGKENATFAEEEGTRTIFSKDDFSGNGEVHPLLGGKTEATSNVCSGPPHPASGPAVAGSSENDLPAAATSGVEGAVDPDGGGEALAKESFEGADTFNLSSSLPYLPTAASAAPFLISTGAIYTSPSVGANYAAAGRAPAGERLAGLRVCREGEHTKKLPSTSLPQRQEERSVICSPLPTGREDDILEFVVQRPTTGGRPVPGFVVTEGGLLSSASPRPPLYVDGSFVEPAAQFDMRRFVCVPAIEATEAGTSLFPHQHLLRKEQRVEEPLQDGPPRSCTSLPPGAFLLLRPAQGEPDKEAGFACLADENLRTFSSFVPSSFPRHKAKFAPSFGPAEHSPPPYSIPPARSAEEGGRMNFVPFAPPVQTLPLGMPWQVRKEPPAFAAEMIPVPVRPGSKPPPSPLFARGKMLKDEKVVVPNAKRLLCFGHAGDEIKFCLGLLQLPPPPLKYDFLLERRETCFGLCESTACLAVCRKCRMRLPNCPFCHKQSAIRHP